MPCRLVAFVPAHAEAIAPGVWESKAFDREALMQHCRTWDKDAVSVLDGDEVIGIGGWFANEDTAFVSLLLSEKMRKNPVFLHRAVTMGIGVLEDAGIKKIFVDCLKEYTTSIKWLKRMGFKETGTEKEFMGMTILEFVR
jgi:hypothetical protein